MNEKKIKRDYENKGDGTFSIGNQELYNQILWYIRQYPDWKKLYKKLKNEPDYTLQSVDLSVLKVNTNLPSNTTQNTALKNVELMLSLETYMSTVDEALSYVHKDFREGVFKHVIDRVPFSDPIFDSGKLKEWSSWKKIFIYNVSVNLGYTYYIEALKTLNESVKH